VKLADAPDVLTVEQARAVLQCSRGLMYELVRTGQVKSIRLGRSIRVPKHALEDLLGGTVERNGNGGPPP
jgi:excisionase family DNA binding protein